MALHQAEASSAIHVHPGDCHIQPSRQQPRVESPSWQPNQYDGISIPALPHHNMSRRRGKNAGEATPPTLSLLKGEVATPTGRTGQRLYDHLLYATTAIRTTMPPTTRHTVGEVAGRITSALCKSPICPFGKLRRSGVLDTMEDMHLLCDAMGVNAVDIIDGRIATNRLDLFGGGPKHCNPIKEETRRTNPPQVPTPAAPRNTRRVSSRERFLECYSDLSRDVQQHAEERNELHRYTELSLCLSLAVKMGQLAEVFQWIDPSTPLKALSGDVVSRCSAATADVFINLIHACRVLGMDQDSITNSA